MRADGPIAPLLDALRALEGFLRAEKLEHAYIGGLAVALLGRPRMTQDIDGIVLPGGRTVPVLLRRAKAKGFPARIQDAEAFTARTRVLLLVHVATGVPVDLSIGGLPFEEDAVRRARPVTVRGLTIPVATVEDLLVLKGIAGRPRDIVDIEGLLAVNPEVDRKRVLADLAGFADVLEAPEIVRRLEGLLRPAERPTRIRRISGPRERSGGGPKRRPKR